LGIPDSLNGVELKGLLRDMYREIFANPDSAPRFFSEDYAQTTDGHSISYAEFIEHIHHVISVTERIEIEVVDVIRDGNRIADRHTVKLIHKDGTNSLLEVYLFGTLHNGRFTRVIETTRLIEGNEASRALATEVR